MLRVTNTIVIDERDLEERFIRASGPGGQNVNKVSTAVELRFDVRATQCLSQEVRIRLIRLAGSRMTDQGVLIIRAEKFRTQDRNRDDARERLADLIRAAAVIPARRIATKTPRSVKLKRLEAKGHRSTVKRLRQARSDHD